MNANNFLFEFECKKGKYVLYSVVLHKLPTLTSWIIDYVIKTSYCTENVTKTSLHAETDNPYDVHLIYSTLPTSHQDYTYDRSLESSFTEHFLVSGKWIYHFKQ